MPPQAQRRRPAGPVNPNYKDQYLQVQFTSEDAGAFTTPWTASMVYLRGPLEWPEVACRIVFQAEKC
jgi:hypothetical protein